MLQVIRKDATLFIAALILMFKSIFKNIEKEGRKKEMLINQYAMHRCNSNL